MTDVVRVPRSGKAANQNISVDVGPATAFRPANLGPRFTLIPQRSDLYELVLGGWSWSRAFSRHVAGVDVVIYDFAIDHHSDDLHNFDLAMNEMLADLRQGRMPQFAPDVLDAAEVASQRRAPTSSTSPPAWVERVARATAKLDD